MWLTSPNLTVIALFRTLKEFKSQFTFTGRRWSQPSVKTEKVRVESWSLIPSVWALSVFVWNMEGSGLRNLFYHVRQCPGSANQKPEGGSEASAWPITGECAAEWCNAHYDWHLIWPIENSCWFCLCNVRFVKWVHTCVTSSLNDEI